MFSSQRRSSNVDPPPPGCPQSTQEVAADPRSSAVTMVVASQQVNWASCVMGSMTVEMDRMRKTAVIPNLAHVMDNSARDR